MELKDSKQLAINFLKYKELLKEDRTELCELGELLASFLDKMKEISEVNFNHFNSLNLLETNKLLKRKGKVSFLITILSDNNFLENIFQKFYPIKSYISMMGKNIVYEGFSPLFRELEDNEEIPEYELIYQSKVKQEINCVEAKEIKQS